MSSLASSGVGPDLALLQLRHAGGALARHEPGAGARATLPGEVVLFALGVVTDPDAGVRVAGALDEVAAAVAGQRVGQYPNFVEEQADASTFFDPETWARLRQVKATYDPQDVFRGNHHVAPGR